LELALSTGTLHALRGSHQLTSHASQSTSMAYQPAGILKARDTQHSLQSLWTVITLRSRQRQRRSPP